MNQQQSKKKKEKKEKKKKKRKQIEIEIKKRIKKIKIDVKIAYFIQMKEDIKLQMKIIYHQMRCIIWELLTFSLLIMELKKLRQLLNLSIMIL